MPEQALLPTRAGARRHPGFRSVVRAVLLLLALAVLVAAGQQPAAAHPLSTTALLLDVHQDRVDVEVQLPLDRLAIAVDQQLRPADVLSAPTLPGLRNYVRAHLAATGSAGPAWTTTVSGGRVESVDGVDHLVLDAVLTPPEPAVEAFELHYDGIVEHLVSHRVFVAARLAGATDYTEVAVLSWQQQDVALDPADLDAPQGFGSMVGLGVGHISEGSDHLLFLIMLLLPAPLLAHGHRWLPRRSVRVAVWRVVQVATAFAVGHSVTLALGAAGLVQVPTRAVEAGIAVSVLVSAIHAARPLVRRGEVLIAAGFGLLHGLAFATLLDELSLSRADLVSNLLGFNLGIELTQLAVVGLLMPSLLLLSRTPAYPAVRTVLAGVGALLATGWLAERLGLLERNPLQPTADVLVTHPLLLAAGLAALAVTARCLPSRRTTAHVNLA